MSTHFVKFRSRALARNGEFYIHLPEKPENLPIFLQGNPYYRRPAKTLILLHGYSGDCDDWLYNSAAADFSMRYNLAVVMPTGGLDFYVDKKATGRQNCKFIGEDLIKYLRDTFNLAQKREDTLIGGLSMGGYGALHTGLMYPETFGGIMAVARGYTGTMDYAKFAFAFRSMEAEKTPPSEKAYNPYSFKPETDLNEEFIIEVSEEVFERALATAQYKDEERAELRYIDEGDTLTLKCGDRTYSKKVTDVWSEKDVTEEDRLALYRHEEGAEEKFVNAKTLLFVCLEGYKKPVFTGFDRE